MEYFGDVTSTNEDLSEDEMVALSDSLFKSVMQGEWGKVEKAYREHSEQAPKLRIAISGDTALHIAVSSDGQKEVVLRLVEIINNYDKNNKASSSSSTSYAREILSIQNSKGNTPLHLAAMHGDLKVCHKMAQIDPKLVSVRNKDSETPLFLAAQCGNSKAFFCLRSHCDENCDWYRAGNGDTFLHAAIAGEHFGLAYQIFLWYPDLINLINQNGMTPFHILASIPTAFRSSCRLSPRDRLIYHCLVVEELEDETEKNSVCPKEGKEGGRPSVSAAETWERWLCGCLTTTTRAKGSRNSKTDIENPPPAPQHTKSSSVQGKPEPDQLGAQKQCIYGCFLKFCYFITAGLVMIDGFLPAGISSIKKIHEEKRRHVWATQVMKELVLRTTTYRYVQNPEDIPTKAILHEVPDPTKEIPDPTKSTSSMAQDLDRTTSTTRSILQEILDHASNTDKKKNKGDDKNKAVNTQTPILIAAKNGVTEMVKSILESFPVAIHDLDLENKNIALLAVENRQPHVYNFLINEKKPNVATLLRQLDNNGNNALHLAATYGSYRPWLTPGAALQMQWELKWYMFVKASIPHRLSVRPNKAGQLPEEVFTHAHKDLQKQGCNWLVKTSESCSVVAALIATVAFATSASVPGGLDDSSGFPHFKNRPAFDAFTISSLLALCLSVTALVFFLSILTSRYEAHDFSVNLPRKLLFGLTSLFASIASVLVSFCTGHVFLLDRQLKYVAYPMYAATCLPLTIFAIAQVSLYYDLIRVIFKKVPQRSYKEFKTS